MRKTLSGLTVALIVTLAVGLGFPQGKGEEGDAGMAAMAKLAAPGEHHAHLAKLEGKWKSEGKLWMAPGAPPAPISGTMTQKLVLGGRFLQQEFEGTMMGQSFTGFGLEGYDNQGGKHVAIWTDTMGTGVTVMEGTCSADHKVKTMKAEVEDPLSGQKSVLKTVTTALENGSQRFEMFMISGGEETKSMEIVYTK